MKMYMACPITYGDHKEGKSELYFTKYKISCDVPTISYCIFKMKLFNIKQLT